MLFFYVFSILFIFGLGPPTDRHPPTAFFNARAFNADISKWDTAAVTSMSQSTSTPLVSVVLSLEFHSLPLLYFLRFHDFIFVFCPPRHRHPPTAFYYALAFNADLSKWNTAAVTTMYRSTSTPLVSVVLSLELHSLFLLFPSF